MKHAIDEACGHWDEERLRQQSSHDRKEVTCETCCVTEKNLDAVSTAPARSTRCSSLFDKVPSRSREFHRAIVRGKKQICQLSESCDFVPSAATCQEAAEHAVECLNEWSKSEQELIEAWDAVKEGDVAGISHVLLMGDF